MLPFMFVSRFVPISNPAEKPRTIKSFPFFFLFCLFRAGFKFTILMSYSLRSEDCGSRIYAVQLGVSRSALKDGTTSYRWRRYTRLCCDIRDAIEMRLCLPTAWVINLQQTGLCVCVLGSYSYWWASLLACWHCLGRINPHKGIRVRGTVTGYILLILA